MLLSVQGDSSERVSTELNAADLDHDGDHKNEQEERIVEEVLEDVDFVRFQLSGVDFVEDLHQHEGIEENAVMFSALDSPFLDADRRLNSEDFRAYIK